MLIKDNEIVDINTPTGDMRAHIFRPVAPGKYPAILMYSEIFQVTAPIRRTAAMLAGHGFIVACPEIYHEFEQLGTVLAYDEAGTRRLRRFASVHDAAFGVGRLRRSAASHRKAVEAALGGNYRNDAVCSFIGICCARLLHRQGRAQPQAKTHEEGSGPTLQRVHCNHVLRRSSLPLTRVALCPRQRTAR